MKDKQQTFSVRMGGTLETWLDRNGKWGPFESRKRFATGDAADAAVTKLFGSEFANYGIFPNSRETAAA